MDFFNNFVIHYVYNVELLWLSVVVKPFVVTVFNGGQLRARDL